MSELARTRRVLRLSNWMLEQLESAPEHDLGEFLSACMTQWLGMGEAWERHSGESLQALASRAEDALKLGRMD